jgi:hypothetical protein
MRVAKEVESLRGPVESVRVSDGSPFQRKLDELQCELAAPMSLLSDTVARVRLISGGQTAWELTLDVPAKTVRCGAAEFPFPGLPWPRPSLQMFLDGSVIESFIGGREALTSRVYGLKQGETELEVTVKGTKPVELQTWTLKAISADRLTS